MRITQPPEFLSKRSIRVVGPSRCRDRIKIESTKAKIKRINDKMAQDSKNTHLERTQSAQPPQTNSKRLCRVHRPRCQHGHIKIAPVKAKIERISDKTAQDDKTTYLGRARATQPPGYPSKHLHRVVGPRLRRARNKIRSVNIKIKRMNDKMAREDETTYRGRARIVQPPGNNSKHLRRVHRPHRRRGRAKSRPRNVSQTQTNGNAYLQRINAIRSIQRPKKGIKRLKELTFEYRMQGEPRCDVEDHG